MHPKDQRQLAQHLGRLFSESLNVSQPVAMLYILKEKITDGGYDPYYKVELLDELGRLQHRLGEVHKHMLSVANLLQQKG